jgi:hypothetical protein
MTESGKARGTVEMSGIEGGRTELGMISKEIDGEKRELYCVYFLCMALVRQSRAW